MYILYLDESGDESNRSDRHFVLAGAAIFERQTYHLSQALDDLQARLFPDGPPVDFHAAPIRAGKGRWRSVTKADRALALQGVAKVIAAAPALGVHLFGIVVEKAPGRTGDDAVRLATEQVTQRFDLLLKRLYTSVPSNQQRGLLVFAEGRFHKRARLWVQGFRELGTQWNVLRNLSDIPYFAAANETRLLQLADYIAYALYRLYERQDIELIRPILHRFDMEGGKLHGLMHVRGGRHCDCPACFNRREPGGFGPWMNSHGVEG